LEEIIFNKDKILFQNANNNTNKQWKNHGEKTDAIMIQSELGNHQRESFGNRRAPFRSRAV
jgi:hypothetical protein